MATALLHGGAATRPGAALAARPSRRTGVRSGVPPPAAAARPRLALRPPPCTAGACFPARRGGPPSTRCAASAVSVAAPPPVPAPAGVKLVPAALSVAVGLVIRFLVPCPAGVTMQAWSLLAIFASTITGLVLEPLPVGAWAFVGVTVAVASKVLTFQAAFSAFTSDVIWLIVISFFFAKGFVKTGLGDRVANLFVSLLGKSTLGLSYGLVLAEALIAPAMPSTTARAGGVFLPIITSLAAQSDSAPGPSSRRVGAFLVQAQLQSAAHSSALFLTAAAQNLLALKLAAEVTGAPLSDAWMAWFRAASVPALASLALTPLLVYTIYPPEVKETPGAPAAARARLQAMGPLSRPEQLMCAAMALAVSLWVGGEALGVPPVLAAMLALVSLLLSGVLAWSDCLAERSAWDTLLWFSVLVAMSGQLNSLGLVRAAADGAAAALAAARLAPAAVALLVNFCYFAAHYAFASQTAHVGALLAACLAVMLAGGVPPVLASLSLAFTTNLFGGISHYSSGQSAVYYGAGFTKLADTLRVGAICGLANLAVWATVGSVWWKVIGLY